jgi:DNA replication protein DnaC
VSSSARQRSRSPPDSAVFSHCCRAVKTLDQFDFAAADGIDAAQVAELARCAWLERGENVLLAGPIGTGKTHLAIALGIEAARQRKHVVFVRAAELQGS